MNTGIFLDVVAPTETAAESGVGLLIPIAVAVVVLAIVFIMVRKSKKIQNNTFDEAESVSGDVSK